jgi:hypothetical protein
LVTPNGCWLFDAHKPAWKCKLQCGGQVHSNEFSFYMMMLHRVFISDVAVMMVLFPERIVHLLFLVEVFWSEECNVVSFFVFAMAVAIVIAID